MTGPDSLNLKKHWPSARYKGLNGKPEKKEGTVGDRK